MEPFEVAELLAGEISSSEGNTGVRILENAPADVGGARGFKLVVAYKDGDGLRMKSVLYGALTERWLWSLNYTAPARVYFEKDLPTFQRVVASFRLMLHETGRHQFSGPALSLNASPPSLPREAENMGPPFATPSVERLPVRSGENGEYPW